MIKLLTKEYWKKKYHKINDKFKNNLIKTSDYFKSLKYYIYNYFISYFPSYKLRILYLRKILKYQIGENSFIHLGCFFYGNKIKIGKNTVIGRNCCMGEDVTIGDNCSITAQTYIFSTSHIKDSPTFQGCYNPVTIGNRVWTGVRSMILPGVNIGDGAILGAQSVATKDIPPYKVFAGCPAKEVSKRAQDLTYELYYFPPFD